MIPHYSLRFAEKCLEPWFSRAAGIRDGLYFLVYFFIPSCRRICVNFQNRHIYGKNNVLI